jgi:hypothetical protein
MKTAEADFLLFRGISSRQEANLRAGGDAMSIVEPVDLKGIQRTPTTLAPFEGEALALPQDMLDYVSTRPCDSREECDPIETMLDRHYQLMGSGYGAAWDCRHRCARLVRL